VSSILQTIVETKRREIALAQQRIPMDALLAKAAQASPARDFAGAIRQHPKISLIAEVKKASPSKGIIRADFHPVEIARTYALAGAQCLSVLTDETFFHGHLDYLTAIRAAVDLPLLRKDFILDEYQVVEARAAGADAVLLIAECLTATELQRLHKFIVQWGMTPLVELYDSANLPAVLACQPSLVGVNNRDLNSFIVDLNHSIRMRKQVPENILFVSESGIASPDDVRMLSNHGVNAILVGESLMRQLDIAQAVRVLMRAAESKTQKSVDSAQ
jgi:indole-3-glycerol phosphate synthase